MQRRKCKATSCLIRKCERLILPYIVPIHKALVARLLEGTGVNVNNCIIHGVLVTVGDLTRVGGYLMRQYIPEHMPLIVEALLDGAAITKREVAVAILGQVVQSTGLRSILSCTYFGILLLLVTTLRWLDHLCSHLSYVLALEVKA